MGGYTIQIGIPQTSETNEFLSNDDKVSYILTVNAITENIVYSYKVYDTENRPSGFLAQRCYERDSINQRKIVEKFYLSNDVNNISY